MIKLNLKTSWVVFCLGCGFFLFEGGYIWLLLSTLEGTQNFEAIIFCTHQWHSDVSDAVSEAWTPGYGSRVMKLGTTMKLHKHLGAFCFKDHEMFLLQPQIHKITEDCQWSQVLGRHQSIQSILRETPKTPEI